MSRVSDLLDDADEFIIITMKKNNDAQLDVGVIMGCDPGGPMLDVLDNVVKDAKDAASSYSKRAETDSDQTESDGNSKTSYASSV